MRPDFDLAGDCVMRGGPGGILNNQLFMERAMERKQVAGHARLKVWEKLEAQIPSAIPEQLQDVERATRDIIEWNKMRITGELADGFKYFPNMAEHGIATANIELLRMAAGLIR